MRRMTFPRSVLTGLSCCALWAVASPSTAATPALDCEGSGGEPRVIDITLDGVPALVRIPETTTLAPIFLWHGFGPPASERALMEALPLDGVPAIKVYLGLPMFGRRMHPRGMEELVERQQKDVGLLVFEPVVMGAANELRNVAGALIEAGCLDPDEGVGLFGFSAGGASTLLALADRKVNVKAAVILNASTGLSASVAAFERATGQRYTWTPASRELADRSDAQKRAADIASGTPPPALLIIHGKQDQMAPPELAVDLYEALRPRYEQAGVQSRLQLALVSDMAHAWIGTSAAEQLRAQISQWFRQHLRQSD